MPASVTIMRNAFIYTALILFADTLGLMADTIFLGRNMFQYLTLFTLAEAAFMFLLGGAFDVAASLSFTRIMDRLAKHNTTWSIDKHRKAQSKAAPIIVSGVFLLVLSFALAYPLK